MTSTRTRFLFSALLTATALAAGATAYAQTGIPMWDTSQLPETKGTVKQYTLTPRGDVDGLILNDGTEVKLPPHLTAQIVFAVKPGDAVTVRGLRARALALIDASSVTNFITGATVTDNGLPDGPGRTIAETTVTGSITAVLHGKRGEVNGALLHNGATLRLPPPEAERMQSLLQPGQAITARGVSLVTALGTVVDVRAIGSSPDQLTELQGPPSGGPGPKGEPKDRRPSRVRDDFGPPPPPPGPRG
jgi:hypothetical protein